MSQSFASGDGVMLFACTKCNSRHPFEDLSQGHQLCKSCKGSFQIIKCNYCRTEFHQDTPANPTSDTNSNNKSSTSICKKCENLQHQHGKPGPCAYCNIIAAFIGSKCQRCTNSEKKYGPPMSCEHCRQKCAFDRKDPESKRKVDGKLLCWLCTLAYKRTLAKARQKEAIIKSSFVSHRHHEQNHHQTTDPKSYSSSSGRHHHSSNGSQRHSSSNVGGGSSSSSYQRSSSSRPLNQSSSSGHRESSSANKKQRMDLTGPSNGHLTSSLSSLSDTRFIDPNNSDLGSVVSQLKDEVSSLNKRIQMKEKELLSKDKQIADLKSISARDQKDMREKINNLQRQHNERISEMQTKLVAMQKQIVTQSKAQSQPRNNHAGYAKPPLVI